MNEWIDKTYKWITDWMNDKMNDDDEKDMKLLSMNLKTKYMNPYTIYINTILYKISQLKFKTFN